MSDDSLIGQLDQVISVLAQIIDDIQTMIFDLNPPVLSLLDLGPALEWLAERMQDEHGLAIAVTHEGEPLPMDNHIRILLFRAAKKLLINVVKHSGSRVARVSVRRAGRMTVDSKSGGTRVLTAVPPRSVGNTGRAKGHSPT